MVVCDFNMCFTFVWAEWEGTAHDTRIFNEPELNFPRPTGDKYYVVDAGYPNTRGYLAPYKGTNIRYHIPDFQRGRTMAMHAPRVPKEKFNYYHSSLRNIIERTFGVWKARWALLKDMHVNFKYRNQFDEAFTRAEAESYVPPTEGGTSNEVHEEGSSTRRTNVDDNYMAAIRDIIAEEIGDTKIKSKRWILAYFVAEFDSIKFISEAVLRVRYLDHRSFDCYDFGHFGKLICGVDKAKNKFDSSNNSSAVISNTTSGSSAAILPFKTHSSYLFNMEKFLTKRKTTTDPDPAPSNVDKSKQSRVEVNLADLPSDPGMRIRILDYNPNIRDEVQRSYLLKGPCQPRNHEFPYTLFGSKQRRFNPIWFDEYPSWLEYSVNQNAAYCLSCYLFKPNIGAQAGGDSFVGLGFKNWSRKEKLRIHVGNVNSAHNQTVANCAALMSNKQHIENVIIKQSDQRKIDYKIRLNTSIDCVRFLLRRGLAFRGHDEGETSKNRGNFIELLQFLADHNKSIEVVTFKNALENLKLTSPDIQKDIVNAAATEITKLIVSDLGDDFFLVLVDESRDVSIKEQMNVVVRYVDTKGHIIERFLGVEHVPNTTSISLKTTLDDLFS
ncbi:hypothetical protein OSB04_016344 [Centaurea solstitialis]|uniref:TTF-type domain-containing protein n=1 Tax=Centaurea solstitialis TaxID=347529 RepID=A0AA38T0R7_9ASTR|nr:hypothetical protein OSB04_016344 [Centaurea solstitialis]